MADSALLFTWTLEDPERLLRALGTASGGRVHLAMAQTSILCHHHHVHQLALVAEMSAPGPEDPPRPSSKQRDLGVPRSPALGRRRRASGLNLGTPDAFVLETSTLVEACIHANIREQPSVESRSFSHEVILLCTEEIRRKNKDNFEGMCTLLELSTSSLYSSVQQILRAMFADNIINWGRILSLLAFGRHLAQHCSKNCVGKVTESLTAWITTFICTRLQAWIVDHGGWAGLAQLKKPQTQQPQKHQKEGWLQMATSGMELGVRFYSFLTGTT